QRADRRHQVTQAGGLLEIQALGGAFHRAAQLVGQLVAAPLEQQGGAADALGILARRHQSHAGRAAAADLVLQARPGPVAEHAVLATAQLEQLVHQVERVADRADARIRTEVPAGYRAWPAMDRDPRPGFVGEQDVGIALVVAQQHVVARLERLDQLVLEDQGLGFGAGDRHLHPHGLRQHRHDPRRLRGRIEVAGDAVLQRARLADVQDLVVGADHPVHAGRGTEAARERLSVEWRRRGHVHPADRWRRFGAGATAWRAGIGSMDGVDYRPCNRRACGAVRPYSSAGRVACTGGRCNDRRMLPPVAVSPRAVALARRKRVAVAMLAAAAVLFVAATWMEVRHPHWAFGLLVAMAEAAMIGGLADWFAVVALFRHPLGQRWIPHTAIIPNRKDALGRALAD